MPKVLLSFSDESWANAGVAEPVECKLIIYHKHHISVIMSWMYVWICFTGVPFFLDKIYLK